MPTSKTGTFGIGPASAMARKRNAPAIPRTALPNTGPAPLVISMGRNACQGLDSSGSCPDRETDLAGCDAAERGVVGRFSSASILLSNVSRRAAICSNWLILLSTACGILHLRICNDEAKLSLFPAPGLQKRRKKRLRLATAAGALPI